MVRVCGAGGERDALSARRCWCGGLFCYRGGTKATTAWRKVFKKPGAVARSRDEYIEHMTQRELYTQVDPGVEWLEKLDAYVQARTGRRLSLVTSDVAEAS